MAALLRNCGSVRNKIMVIYTVALDCANNAYLECLNVMIFDDFAVNKFHGKQMASV